MIRRMDQVVLSFINKTGKPDVAHRHPTESDVAEAKLRIRGAAKDRRVVKRKRD